MVMFGDLCTNCKTGMDSLNLDPQSPHCPYLELYKDGICPAYEVMLNEPEAENSQN